MGLATRSFDMCGCSVLKVGHHADLVMLEAG